MGTHPAFRPTLSLQLPLPPRGPSALSHGYRGVMMLSWPAGRLRREEQATAELQHRHEVAPALVERPGPGGVEQVRDLHRMLPNCRFESEVNDY